MSDEERKAASSRRLARVIQIKRESRAAGNELNLRHAVEMVKAEEQAEELGSFMSKAPDGFAKARRL